MHGLYNLVFYHKIIIIIKEYLNHNDITYFIIKLSEY